MKFKKLISFIIIFIYFSVAISADVIYLKNGEILEGRVLDQSKTKVKIEINGKPQILEKDDIKEIVYEKSLPEKVEQNNEKQTERKKIQQHKPKTQKKPVKTQEKEFFSGNINDNEDSKYLQYVLYGILIWFGLGLVLTKLHTLNLEKSNNLYFSSTHFSYKNVLGTSLFLFTLSYPFFYTPEDINYDIHFQNLQKKMEFNSFYNKNEYPIFMFKKEF